MFQTKKARPAPVNVFPFHDKRVAYFKIENDSIVQVVVNKNTVGQLKSTDGKLYAAWPGQYKTDIFEIPLLELFKAFMLTDPLG